METRFRPVCFGPIAPPAATSRPSVDMPGPVRVLRVQAGGGHVSATQRAFGNLRPVVKVHTIQTNRTLCRRPTPPMHGWFGWHRRCSIPAAIARQPRSRRQPKGCAGAAGATTHWAPMHTPPRLRGAAVRGPGNQPPSLRPHPLPDPATPLAAQGNLAPAPASLETPARQNGRVAETKVLVESRKKFFKIFWAAAHNSMTRPEKLALWA